jgi:23S rRNA (pseudouridine1915-N3)-methyltransferase
MLFKILCVGKLKDKYFESRVRDYLKRISYDAKISITEVKDSNRETECKKLAELIDKEKGFVIMLSEDGKQLSSRQFAQKIDRVQQKVVLVIGGPFGLTLEIKKKANLLLSFSEMTFTHEMIRLFLAEQIYRAVSIIKGRKYHND